MNQIALIGPTACGKTALAIELAQKLNAHILSLDSLALYQEIDIISAKPTLTERQGIPHHGIDVIPPNAHFNAQYFSKLHATLKKTLEPTNTPLIIVGGTGFYLKALIEGFSPEPSYSQKTQQQTAVLMQDLKKAHCFLREIDPERAKHIAPNDRYRLTKALHLYFETQMSPTEYYHENPPIPPESSIKLYEIAIDKSLLDERIRLRTTQMIKQGAIDETAALEQRYGRRPKSMQSIGIKEILGFFDGLYDRTSLHNAISIHTSQLAKRQMTFNRHQFNGVKRLQLSELRDHLITKYRN